MPLTAVFSGSRATRDRAVAVIESVGFEIDDRHGEHHWGFPSHRNHDEALLAGKPNAGHTPGTPHPVTGAPYEPDLRVSFITARTVAEPGLHSAMLGDAELRLIPLGWTERSHWSKELAVLTKEQVQSLRGFVASVGRGR
jgi:hypothetical protein